MKQKQVEGGSRDSGVPRPAMDVQLSRRREHAVPVLPQERSAMELFAFGHMWYGGVGVWSISYTGTGRGRAA